MCHKGERHRIVSRIIVKRPTVREVLGIWSCAITVNQRNTISLIPFQSIKSHRLFEGNVHYKCITILVKIPDSEGPWIDID